MSRTELLRTLSVYRRSREQLVAAFITEEPEPYQAMFQFRSGSVAMSLAVERFILLWLIRHPAIYQELYLSQGEGESEEEQQLFVSFMKHYFSYCKCFIVGEDSKAGPSPGPIDGPVTQVLLLHKRAFLDDLLKVSQNADARLQRLRYQSTKTKALFDRQFAALRRQQHGPGNTR